MVRLRVIIVMQNFIYFPYFNSCMVRLRAPFRDHTSGALTYFNSCMVRLRVAGFFLHPQETWLFQFLYGAIKSPWPYGFHLQLPTFQFLYGAIKRFDADYFGGVSFEFQFLYGAIKSGPAKRKRNRLIYFNSCMVRLRDRTLNAFHLGVRVFQFLYGAIKRVLPGALFSIL